MERALFGAAVPVSRDRRSASSAAVDELAFYRGAARGNRREDHADLTARARVERDWRAEVAAAVGRHVRLERAGSDLQEAAERACLTGRNDVHVRSGQCVTAQGEVAADLRAGTRRDVRDEIRCRARRSRERPAGVERWARRRRTVDRYMMRARREFPIRRYVEAGLIRIYQVGYIASVDAHAQRIAIHGLAELRVDIDVRAVNRRSVCGLFVLQIER